MTLARTAMQSSPTPADFALRSLELFVPKFDIKNDWRRQAVVDALAVMLCSSEVQQPQRPTTALTDLPQVHDLRQRPATTFVPLDGKEEVRLTLKCQYQDGRGTSGAHHREICPEMVRSAEISAAGQRSYRRYNPRSAAHCTRPGLQAGSPATHARQPCPPAMPGSGAGRPQRPAAPPG